MEVLLLIWILRMQGCGSSTASLMIRNTANCVFTENSKAVVLLAMPEQRPHPSPAHSTSPPPSCLAFKPTSAWQVPGPESLPVTASEYGGRPELQRGHPRFSTALTNPTHSLLSLPFLRAIYPPGRPGPIRAARQRQLLSFLCAVYTPSQGC